MNPIMRMQQICSNYFIEQSDILSKNRPAEVERMGGGGGGGTACCVLGGRSQQQPLVDAAPRPGRLGLGSRSDKSRCRPPSASPNKSALSSPNPSSAHQRVKPYYLRNMKTRHVPGEGDGWRLESPSVSDLS